MTRWLVISWVQERFSRDQKRSEASWPALTSSRPSGLRDRLEMEAGWATMLYVHWPSEEEKMLVEFASSHPPMAEKYNKRGLEKEGDPFRREGKQDLPLLASKNRT